MTNACPKSIRLCPEPLRISGEIGRNQVLVATSTEISRTRTPRILPGLILTGLRTALALGKESVIIMIFPFSAYLVLRAGHRLQRLSTRGRWPRLPAIQPMVSRTSAKRANHLQLTRYRAVQNSGFTAWNRSSNGGPLGGDATKPRSTEEMALQRVCDGNPCDATTKCLY